MFTELLDLKFVCIWCEKIWKILGLLDFCRAFQRWSNSSCGYRNNPTVMPTIKATPEWRSTKEQWDWKVREEQNQNAIGVLTLIKSEIMEDFKAQQALCKILFIWTNNCNWSCNINSDGLLPWFSVGNSYHLKEQENKYYTAIGRIYREPSVHCTLWNAWNVCLWTTIILICKRNSSLYHSKPLNTNHSGLKVKVRWYSYYVAILYNIC